MSVTVDITNNQVTVSEAVTNIVEVRAIGPKGSPGITQGTGSLLLTASISDDILTFTKGNSDTFSLTLPSGIDTGSFVVTASVSDNIVTFEKGDSSTFEITIVSSSFATLANSATSASYILANGIDDAVPVPSLTITSLTSSIITTDTITTNTINSGIVSASTYQGAFSFDNLIDVPVFVDTQGEPSQHQLAIFVDNTQGIPEGLPFDLPLINDGNPTIQGLSGLTFDGSTLKIEGIVTGSNIPPNLINLKGNANPDQLVRFVDTTDTELPISMPFYLPVNDGNPTVEAISGLTFSGSILSITGDISSSGDLIANNATINEGFVTVDGASTSHGFELKRDSLDTYKIRHLDGGLTIQNSTDNRKEMSFDGAGNVGIGTSSPSEKLTVSGSLKIRNSGDTRLIIDSQGGSNDDSIIDFRENSVHRALVYFDGNQNDFVISSSIGDFHLLPAGNVGIGTTTPGEKLTVEGNISASGDITASNISSSATGSFAQLSLPNLPTSDPGIAGRLFTTQSTGTGGNLEGQLVLLVSVG